MMSLIAIAVLASGCGDKGGEIAECTAALESIESACAGSGLSEMAKKTCESSKKSIAALAQAAEKTGKTEVAAEGCKKQAEIVARMAGKKPPATKPAASDSSTPADDEPAASAPGGADACAKLSAEVDAACADDAGHNPTQTMICKTSRKSAEVFSKMAVKNPGPAGKGCAKTLSGWSDKGGLEAMVKRAGR